MNQEPKLVRDADAGDSIEIMLVTAVATILVIRMFLHLTGYPQVGGDRLHIAHMLWGGLGMLVALVLLLVYWNPRIRRTAAVFGGIGFGTFIDELGKFITQDNNYFFQPTASLLYVMFVMLFMVLRGSLSRRRYSVRELEINQHLRDDLDSRPSRFQAYFKWRSRIEQAYIRATSKRWFRRAVIAVFVVQGVLGLAAVARVTSEDISLQVNRIEAAASVMSLLLIWMGIWRLLRSTGNGLVWFQRSLLVNILITQPFMFYHDQFAAVGGLMVQLLLYGAVRYMRQFSMRSGGTIEASSRLF